MQLVKNTKIALAFAFAVATALIVYFMPRSSHQRYIYEENRPWSYSLLTAPFDITVYRDSATIHRMTDSIDATMVPIFLRDNSQPTRVLAAIERNDSLPRHVALKLANAVARVYRKGIVNQEVATRITRGQLPEVKFNESNVNVSCPTSEFISQRDAYAHIDSLFTSSDDHRAFSAMGLSSLLQPNIIEDHEATRLYRESLLQPIMAGIGLIQKGEKIIGPAEIVTPQRYQIIRSYEQTLEKQSSHNRSQLLYSLLGKVLFTALTLGLLYMFFRLYYHNRLKQNKFVLLPLMLVTLFFIFTAIVAKLFNSAIYCVPLAALPVIMVVFYDARTAFFLTVIELMLCGLVASYPLEFIFVELTGAAAVIFSLKDLSKRSELVKSAFVAFVTYTLAYLAFTLTISGSPEGISWHLLGYFGINAVLISFAYILIFLLEKLFGMVSVVTLVELSDISSKAIRELSRVCPGTFQHSMAVSNLATEAAHNIGANVQLVRAGALYHDIGKINNPAFFTENQYGKSPHDTMPPIQSARVIINHIHDGLARAESLKLPKAIRDLIAQHHGKGRVKYFYAMECRRHPDQEVDPAPFTYPGPNPQTREASILMMADAVEAASRSLTDHTPEAIGDLVNRLIDGQVAEGLHNDSPLSFRDIKEIKQVFISRLRTMYHARIQYPPEALATPASNLPVVESK